MLLFRLYILPFDQSKTRVPSTPSGHYPGTFFFVFFFSTRSKKMFNRSTLTRSYSSLVRNFKVPTPSSKKTNLIGFTLNDLKVELEGLQHTKSFTPLQIWQHMYKKGITQFEDMPNLSKDLRQELSAKYEISYGEVKVQDLFYALFLPFF